MIKHFVIIISLLLFLTLTISAQGWPRDDADIDPVVEAGLAALWLSDSLFAPEELADEIQNKLALLREQYSEEIPEVNIKFQYPETPTALSLIMEPYALDKLNAGTYHEWDSLNQEFGVKDIVIDTISYYKLVVLVNLEFEDYLNTYLLSSKYLALAGVRHVRSVDWPGDWSCTYPWFVDGQMVFLIRKAWGDCPAGCMHRRYYYFICNNDQINFIGEFGTPEGEFETPNEYRKAFQYPSWWDEIKPAICRYHRRSQDECEAAGG